MMSSCNREKRSISQRTVLKQFKHLEELKRHLIMGFQEAGWSYPHIVSHTGRADTTVTCCWWLWIKEYYMNARTAFNTTLTSPKTATVACQTVMEWLRMTAGHLQWCVLLLFWWRRPAKPCMEAPRWAPRWTVCQAPKYAGTMLHEMDYHRTQLGTSITTFEKST